MFRGRPLCVDVVRVLCLHVGVASILFFGKVGRVMANAIVWL